MKEHKMDSLTKTLKALFGNTTKNDEFTKEEMKNINKVIDKVKTSLKDVFGEAVTMDADITPDSIRIVAKYEDDAEVNPYPTTDEIISTALNYINDQKVADAMIKDVLDMDSTYEVMQEEEPYDLGDEGESLFRFTMLAAVAFSYTENPVEDATKAFGAFLSDDELKMLIHGIDMYPRCTSTKCKCKCKSQKCKTKQRKKVKQKRDAKGRFLPKDA